MSSYQKNLVPKIQEKIENKLQELELVPETTPESFIKEKGLKKHRYFSLCKDSKNKNFLFFARIHNNKDAKNKFITEINFLKESQLNFIPSLTAWGIEDDFEWLQRQEIEPCSISDHEQNQKIIVTRLSSKKIAEYVYKISCVDNKNLGLKKFNYKKYFAFNGIQNLVNRKIIDKDTGLKTKNLIESQSLLLKSEEKFVSHGDLTLENILSDGKRSWIIDWERCSINNRAYDAAFLWSCLWIDQKSRKFFIESYVKNLNEEEKKSFKLLFPVMAVYLAIGEVVMEKKNETDSEKRSRINFSLKVLNYCIEGFEKLIKI